jgi:hypothetical protein
MVNHIATLEDQLQRLTEASTMWQIRAHQAEDKLLQLTAGNVDPDAATIAPGSSPANETGPFVALAVERIHEGLWDRVRRFWSG